MIAMDGMYARMYVLLKQLAVLIPYLYSHKPKSKQKGEQKKEGKSGGREKQTSQAIGKPNFFPRPANTQLEGWSFMEKDGFSKMLWAKNIFMRFFYNIIEFGIIFLSIYYMLCTIKSQLRPDKNDHWNALV